MLLTLEEIIKATGGECLKNNHSRISGELHQDSRVIKEGDCFICIKGEKLDGHSFVEAVDEKNASLIIGTNKEALSKAVSASTLLVSDIQDAVHKIAKAVRHKVKIPVITITGASGKTTTKDLLVSILSQEKKVLSTPLNNNNLWGVPLTLVNLKFDHEVVVLETGTNAEGEVRKLTEICEPTHTYTTSIAESHLEFFKDIDGVLRGETEQYFWMAENIKHPVFLANYQDEILKKFFNDNFESFKQSGAEVLQISDSDNANYKILKKEPLGFEYNFGYSIEIHLNGKSINCILPLLGEHNVKNAIGAVSIAHCACGISESSIIEGLKTAKITGSRSKLSKASDGVFIFDDAYNANPGSMKAAGQALCELKNTHSSEIKRVIAVVSDMLELGESAKDFHKDVGVYFKKIGVDLLFSSGQFSNSWVDGFGSNSTAFNSNDELLKAIKTQRKSGDIILVKASNGSKLYKIVPELV